MKHIYSSFFLTIFILANLGFSPNLLAQTTSTSTVPNNVIERTLSLGESFILPVRLSEQDDILIISRIEEGFFTNIKSSRKSDLVEFELTVARPGKTIIQIDNISQGLEPFITYEITIRPKGETEAENGPGSVMAPLSPNPENRVTESGSANQANQNPLLIREAYLRVKEIINSGINDLAETELMQFKTDYPEAQKEYWELVMTRYENFKNENNNEAAKKEIEKYLSEADNVFLNEAKLILAQELMRENNLPETLKLLFSIEKNSLVYRNSLLIKAEAYENLGRLESAVNSYREYLNVNENSFNSLELPELLPTLNKLAMLYRNPSINDFEMAYSTYTMLLEKAEAEDDFEFQNKARVGLRQLDKHYFNIK